MSSPHYTPFVLETSWQELLKDELKKPYMLALAAFVEREYATASSPVFPPHDLIFSAFALTPLSKVKVVIVGQDPYHGLGQAHGLSFSVPKGVRPPPSLQNIFKELQADLGAPPPNHGNLISWSEQGVLLLNATLTVRENDPLSHHGRGWEQFTDAVLNHLSQQPNPLVFVLWGKSAQEKCRFLKNEKSPHLVLTAAHPSPFSANNGFFGCRHFSKINAWLSEKGMSPINWTVNNC